MSRRYLFVLLGTAAVLTLSGCGGSGSQTNTGSAGTAAETEDEGTAAAGEDAEAEAGDEETGDEAAAEEETGDGAAEDTGEEAAAGEEAGSGAPAEETLESITPSEYLMADAAQYVNLEGLDGLQVTKYSYEVTDDMVQSAVEADLVASGEEVSVDTPAEAGNIVYFDMEATPQGEGSETFTESLYLTLGDEEYGTEFDEAFLGASKDDSLTFTCTFDEYENWADWMDGTVDFKVTVTDVCELNVPEYTDEFVTEYTEYSAKDEYEEALRGLLEEEYAEAAAAESREMTIQAAMDAVEFSEAPQEFYDAAKEEVLEFFQEASESQDEAEILEAFGLTQEDLDAEVLETLDRRLLVSAVCQENGIEVTEEDYTAYVKESADAYGYDSIVDYEQDAGRFYLVWELYEEKAVEYLDGIAEITTVPYETVLEEDMEEIPEEDEIEEFTEDMEEGITEDMEETAEDMDGAAEEIAEDTDEAAEE